MARKQIRSEMRARPCPEGSNLVTLEPRAEPIPGFTWEQLQAQLADLRPERAELTRQVVAMLRARAAGQEPEMVLREVLCAAWTLLEEPGC